MENNIHCITFNICKQKIKTIFPTTRGHLFKVFKIFIIFSHEENGVNLKFYDEFFPASLRYNLHRIKCTHSKCIVCIIIIIYDCITTTTILVLLCFALL